MVEPIDANEEPLVLFPLNVSPTGALWQLRNATESSRGGVDLSMDTLDVNRRAFWMLFNPIMDGSSGVSGRSSEKSLDEGLEASLSPVHSIAALLH